VAKPEIFDGAVGSFSMKVSSSTNSLKVGDPITLSVKIGGTGSFDRVSKYALPKDERWKTYNPEVKFKPLDNTGFYGEKLFEQVLIPQSPDMKELPQPAFAYFDPGTKEYKVLKSDPIPISISGMSALNNKSYMLPQNEEEGRPNSSIPKEFETSLAPIQIETGPNFYSLSPLYKRDWYYALCIFLTLLAIAGTLCRFIYMNLLKNPQYAANIKLEQEIEKIFRDADKALYQADPAAFLSLCRKAAQFRLAYRWKLEPEAVTLSDLLLREPDSYSESKKIFELADAVNYSGSTLSTDELSHLYRTFKDEIRHT